MSSDRIQIRCPNCQTDGSARAELINRRVSCKHCAHVFRAIPVVDGAEPAQQWPSTPAPPKSAASTGPAAKQPSRKRVEVLEQELRRLREDLSTEQVAIGELERLREQLTRAVDANRQAEAREQSLRKEIEGLLEQAEKAAHLVADEGKSSLREEELRFLRDQLDKARAEAESEARKRRETASILTARTAEYAETLTARNAEHDKALKDKEAEHAQALRAKQDEHARTIKEKADEHVRTIDARTAEYARGLSSKEAEHAQSLRELGEHLERARTDARAVEARRLADDSERTEADGRHDEEVQALRDELGNVRAALEGLRRDSEHAEAEHARQVEERDGRLAHTEAQLADADQIRSDRDRLAGDLHEHKSRLVNAERLVAEHRDDAERLRQDRDRIVAEHSAESADLRERLERARQGLDSIETVQRERDEARIQRDRFAEELDALQARLTEADERVADWGYDSTEMNVPRTDPSSEIAAFQTDDLTLYDGGLDGLRNGADRFRAEAEALRQELEQARAAIPVNGQAEAIAEADRASQQARAEAEALRQELGQARESADAAARSNQELMDRIKALEAVPTAPAMAAMAGDPATIEAERKRAVDEAVKGAWADFERRLAETQAKLRAANSRADMLEVEAREAREQIAAHDRGLDFGDGSSFEESASMTSIRILDDRGTARLTLPNAEARLGLARQMAVERKDKALIDRINKMADKVRADLESRNYTLAETLVRGAEIETGLDPGGFSINGQRIFRASPTIVGSLAALIPAFDRVMRQGDLTVIRQTIDEMRTILGDQAGLPEIRRPGRTPAIKRPILAADALRLFVAALEGENWLIRPISSKRPLPDTSLTTYAGLIEACCDARGPAEQHAPDRLDLLRSIIQAAATMIVRRQQVDGHFAFLDPRGRASKLATAVDAMVAQSPGAVKDGWVIQVDPLGTAQTVTAACALALDSAGKALGKPEWTQAALKAADWAMGQPVLPNFVANAASATLLARAYLGAKQDRHLDGLTRKLNLGILPGQVENGRWIDSYSATTPNHLAILRALHNAWEAIPADRDNVRRDLKGCIDRAMASLLVECKALGVPAQGTALRDLIRHRDLFQPQIDARVEPAILDSATVVQELCHDGPKPKLGVAPDQLAALMMA